EFQLDLSLESDIIIADYNYFFDPMVKLERYFGEQADASTSVVLVDEAHNLVDRGRDMFSASLFSLEAEWAKKSLKGDKWKALRKNLSQLGELFEELLSPEESEADLVSVPFEFEKIIENLKKNEQKGTKTETTAMPDEFKRFSRECRKFSRILSTYYNEKTYRIYATREGDGIRLNLLCLDPSAELDASFRSVKGATLFSATLSPINYYMDAIVGRTEEPNLLLQSPFPKENLKMMIAPRVSVRYKDRDRSYAEVADYLKRFIEAKTGNYFLYFPSYEYMENIRPHLDFHGCNILVQGRKMKLDDRLEFLDAFSRNPQVTTVGLLILGGAFSEGIDLVDDRLIGVAIVGVGLPQIGHENNLIRDYRSGEGRNGFDYAYKFPGFNKVTQAVGRLIRSESDVGAALLIDDRYCHADYRPLVQRIWPKHEIVMNPQDVTSSLNSFYKKKEQ
ncbi:MAG: hypothetical protein HUJ60_03875, partial [Bacilli bacterium]|nr:hypothetical protein [Bacilli bacterium]